MAEVISAEDARMMYQDTICEFNGSLVTVIGIDDDLKTLVRELSTSKLKNVKFSTDKFSAPVNGRLGYVNYGSVAAYYVRRPKRQYKNGLCNRNVQLIRGEFEYTRQELDVVNGAIAGTILDANFENCYRNIYPSFEEAQVALQQGARLVAFDRQFALDSLGNVFYKGTKAGMLVRMGGSSVQDIEWKDQFVSIQALIGQFKLKA